ncbi:hypothetical protein EJ06DRAFT_527762 [Trichodelitschia bisporula]|uniref:Uncharacterized protein n=1 Tax=Trichodelitschia bisporula TaxID=703511 RepID=A0A6G1I3F2_9PEZI|nr:hypothetical protein EJ06DRAFT_527762 [Trichodelitschia bisporula]
MPLFRLAHPFVSPAQVISDSPSNEGRAGRGIFVNEEVVELGTCEAGNSMDTGHMVPLDGREEPLG